MNDLSRGCIAEFIGTFALVFFGAGSILLTQSSIDAGSLITVALAHGLVLSVFITGCMYISGAQFNPAVSIALLVIGKQGAAPTAAFVVSQLIAAACGAGMLVFILSPEVANSSSLSETGAGSNVGATIGMLTNEGDTAGVLVLEALQTFALMFVILTTVVDDRGHRLGGFCIGMTVAVCILAFGPMTGSSMNPARTFGPALYGHWDMHWVYWVGPVLGAVLAALVYRAVWMAPRDDAETTAT